MHPLQRPPSVGWETVPLPGISGAVAFLWFRPATSPQMAVFQVPAVTLRDHGRALSGAVLLNAVGLGFLAQSEVPLHYMTAAGGQFLKPDDPLPEQIPGSPPALMLFVPLPMLMAPPVVQMSSQMPSQMPTQLSPQMPVAAATIRPSGASDDALFAAIEGDWHAIRLIESQLSSLRKQLSGLDGKLRSLNRELSIDEKRAADSQDLREWQDTRRWLRDAAAAVSRTVRAYDVGTTSGAGNRNRFDDWYEQFVKPRRPLDDLAGIQQMFESHRKTIVTLQSEMQTVVQGASRDGEQRAQQFLTKIAAKARISRRK